MHRLLKNISASWNEIGFQLPVKDNFRDSLIHSLDTPEVKLERILKEWESTECSDVTWKTVFEVLQNLEKYGVAKEVQEYLKKSDIIEKYINQEDFVKFQPLPL